MGEGRLRQKERIDRENRLNQGGCVLVRGADGEEGGASAPVAFGMQDLLIIVSHWQLVQGSFMCTNCQLKKKPQTMDCLKYYTGHDLLQAGKC